MKADGPYQLLDPLSPEDFAALEADIFERGVMVPIELDEDGNVLDGYHRLLICEKHNITDYPKVIRRGWTEEQKRTHARRMNLARRHMTREQRRKLIEGELRESPGATNRKIAAQLGVDHKTVGKVRKGMEARGEVPQVEQRAGRDGKAYRKVGRSAKPCAAVVDASGAAVPDVLADAFKAVPEFKSLDNMLLEVKRRMLAVAKGDGHLVRRYVDQLRDVLAQNVPHDIHPDCEGRGCEGCEGRGYTVGWGNSPRDQEGRSDGASEKTKTGPGEATPRGAASVSRSGRGKPSV